MKTAEFGELIELNDRSKEFHQKDIILRNQHEIQYSQAKAPNLPPTLGILEEKVIYKKMFQLK